MAVFPELNPAYKPAMRVISAITNANPASITTTQDHLYISGNIVRIDIPLGFGMQQINQQFGEITVTGDTTFTIDIDTTFYDAFVAASSYPENLQVAQAVPFAENNSILLAAVQNTLPH